MELLIIVLTNRGSNAQKKNIATFQQHIFNKTSKYCRLIFQLETTSFYWTDTENF